MAKDKEKKVPETESDPGNLNGEKQPEQNAGEEKTEQKEKKADKKTAEKKNDKTAQLEAALAEANDKFLRTAAEYDNFRRRSQKEKESIYNDSKADAVAKLIPVMDNFERAAAAEANPEDYKKGVEMIFRQFSDVLTALGVEAFGEAGEAFDPNIHSGVSHIEDENLGENTISAVYQKGYKIGDRIIRHAAVVVAN